MIDRHHLSPTEYAALAGGHGGAGAVRSLGRGQLSKHLLLVKFIGETWTGDPADRDRAMNVLIKAQAAAPDAVGDLLADPMVGAWAAWTARRVRGTIHAQTPLWVDSGHLAAIAVAAAAHSGVDADLTLYVRDGRVAIPGLGCALIAEPDFTPVRVTARNGTVVVHGAGGTVRVPGNARSDGDSWQGMRLLTAQAHDHSININLDDLDPYRDGHHAPAAKRLSPEEVQQWGVVFAASWELLTRYVPRRADELAAGLRSVVPLARLDPRSARSATVRDAFGSFGLTLPSTAADFAVALVHEFQHSKLSGILDLMPLYDPAARELHYAPWRTDPRPIGGLLQGVYAFVGIADLWRALRDCPVLAQRAEQEFASVREQVSHALVSLEDCDALNPAGRRFTAGMRAVVDPMLAEPLPAGVVELAQAALTRNRHAWHRRNGAELRR